MLCKVMHRAWRSACAHDTQGALNLAARIAFSPAAITVPVWFHVITKTDGTGNVTQPTLQASVRPGRFQRLYAPKAYRAALG